MKKLGVMLIILTLVISCLSVGFAARGYSSFKIAFEGSKPNDNFASPLAGYLYEGLYGLKNGEVIPEMAASDSVSENGLIHTFALERRQWSDGTFVTAQDFVNGWNRLVNNSNFPEFFSIRHVDPYRAVDDFTFEVTLTEPIKDFYAVTTHMCLSPFKSADLYNGRYVNKASGNAIKLKQNPYYYNVVNYKNIDVYGDITYADYISSPYDMYLTANPWSLQVPYDVSDSTGTFAFLLNPDRITDQEKRQQIIKVLMDGVYPSQYSKIRTNRLMPETIKSPYTGNVFNAVVDESSAVLSDMDDALTFLVYDTPIHMQAADEVKTILEASFDVTVSIVPESDWSVFLERRDDMDYDITYFGWLFDWFAPDNLLNFYANHFGLGYDLNTGEEYDAYVQAKIDALIELSVIVPISEYMSTYIVKDSDLVRQEANGVFWFK